MFTKILWLVAFGLVAYVLELGFGLRETRINLVVMTIGVPILFLYALSNIFPGLSGRLKGAESIDSATSDSSHARDDVFSGSAVIYVFVYLGVRLHVRPRDWELSIDLLGSLSPIELFWLIAPIVSFWWYRQLR